MHVSGKQKYSKHAIYMSMKYIFWAILRTGDPYGKYEPS